MSEGRKEQLVAHATGCGVACWAPAQGRLVMGPCSDWGPEHIWIWLIPESRLHLQWTANVWAKWWCRLSGMFIYFSFSFIYPPGLYWCTVHLGRMILLYRESYSKHLGEDLIARVQNWFPFPHRNFIEIKILDVHLMPVEVRSYQSSSFAGLVYAEQHFLLPPGVYGFTIHKEWY